MKDFNNNKLNKGGIHLIHKGGFGLVDGMFANWEPMFFSFGRKSF